MPFDTTSLCGQDLCGQCSDVGVVLDCHIEDRGRGVTSASQRAQGTTGREDAWEQRLRGSEVGGEQAVCGARFFYIMPSSRRLKTKYKTLKRKVLSMGTGDNPVSRTKPRRHTVGHR